MSCPRSHRGSNSGILAQSCALNQGYPKVHLTGAPPHDSCPPHPTPTTSSPARAGLVGVSPPPSPLWPLLGHRHVPRPGGLLLGGTGGEGLVSAAAHHPSSAPQGTMERVCGHQGRGLPETSHPCGALIPPSSLSLSTNSVPDSGLRLSFQDDPVSRIQVPAMAFLTLG